MLILKKQVLKPEAKVKPEISEIMLILNWFKDILNNFIDSLNNCPDTKAPLKVREIPSALFGGDFLFFIASANILFAVSGRFDSTWILSASNKKSQKHLHII